MESYQVKMIVQAIVDAGDKIAEAIAGIGNVEEYARSAHDTEEGKVICESCAQFFILCEPKNPRRRVRQLSIHT